MRTIIVGLFLFAALFGRSTCHAQYVSGANANDYNNYVSYNKAGYDHFKSKGVHNDWLNQELTMTAAQFAAAYPTWISFVAAQAKILGNNNVGSQYGINVQFHQAGDGPRYPGGPDGTTESSDSGAPSSSPSSMPSAVFSIGGFIVLVLILILAYKFRRRQKDAAAGQDENPAAEPEERP
jgi:hypothetical protein